MSLGEPFAGDAPDIGAHEHGMAEVYLPLLRAVAGNESPAGETIATARR